MKVGSNFSNSSLKSLLDHKSDVEIFVDHTSETISEKRCKNKWIILALVVVITTGALSFYFIRPIIINVHEKENNIICDSESPKKGSFERFIVGLGRNDISIGCGGIFITNQHILTAAHCLTNPSSPITFIQFGSSLNHRKTKEFTAAVHKDYVAAPTNDIAIIKLKYPVECPLFHHSIELPLKGDHIPKNLTSVEWVNKQTVQVRNKMAQFMDIKDCEGRISLRINKTYKLNYMTEYDGDSSKEFPLQICTSYQKDEYIPQGNSGLPLLYLGQGRTIIYGIFSRGPKKDKTDLPGIYTNIAPYREWIQNNIGEEFSNDSRIIY